MKITPRPSQLRLLALPASLVFTLAAHGQASAPPKPSPETARAELRKDVLEFFTGKAPERSLLMTAPEAQRPEPERASLAAAATVSFQQPAEILSHNGVLSATLVGMKAVNRIGDDPVYLRSYNGALVGPTLRAKPGDVLRIVVRNDLAPEATEPGEMNTLHAFNTMNLHTHGLHVSPSGISDNVLLEIPPRSSQDYEIHIPKDHPAGTFWYHPHKHGSTAAQVSSGMAGALIITGGLDEVKEIKDATERVLVFQQIAYVNKVKDPDGKERRLPYGVIEPEYADQIFGPGDWEALGRYTTINGIKLPVFRVQPGSVERWRMIHAGIRESISLTLERAPGAPTTIPARIALKEIALDGLALGKATAGDQPVELWPGYRSDVLVQFPEIPAGDYLLVDGVPESGGTLTGAAESRKYVARVIVEGPKKPMKLPTDAQMTKYRLPSIDPKTPNMGQQDVTYAIVVKDGKVAFNINDKMFSMDSARTLKLGGTDNWTLKTRNIGTSKPPSHPHHIHVNPFEVYSIKDAAGKETLDAPVWRDTLILHEGWTVQARSSYTVYDGLFVQHCHILDHEDSGMMQLVEVEAPTEGKKVGSAEERGNPSRRVTRTYAAPQWELTDAQGVRRQLQEYRGRPTVLVFFKGHGCLHCNEQLALLKRRHTEFERLGATVLAISSDESDVLAKAVKDAPTPLTMVSDAAGKAFRAYGCFMDEPLHGTFILDGRGQVRWQAIGVSPYMAVDSLLAEVERLSPAPAVATARE